MFGWKKRKSDRAASGNADQPDIIRYIDSGEAEPDNHHPRSPRAAIRPAAAPPPPASPPARRNPLFLIFNGLISLLIFVFVLAAAIFFVGKQQFESAGPLVQTRAVIIPKGANLGQISRRLEREGVVADGTLFSAGVYISKMASQLKAGEYVFKERASMREVMELLVEGKSVLHKVTIPEGLTSEQIVAILEADELLSGEIAEIPAEGTLLPDTYKFTRGTDRKEIVDRMHKAHARQLERVWGKRDNNLPVKTPRELVILASIVEKETGKADERPRVASVFVNRLKRSIRLQSDPTIIYGLVGGKGKLGRPILRSEIDKETPYNTYQIDGLPPTPIANPGVAALEAVANPSRTNDLYFVADGEGGHIFASTLAEHNENVARWRKIRDEARKQAEEAVRNEVEKEAGGEAPDKPSETKAPPTLDLSPLRR